MRTYSGFASHSILYFSFRVGFSGQWKSVDTFSIQFDEMPAQVIFPYSATLLGQSNTCGNVHVPSLMSDVVGKEFHTASDLTIKISWNILGGGSPAASIMIKDLRISFATKTSSDVREAYIVLGIPSVVNSTKCTYSEYYDPSSSQCLGCNSDCGPCFGPLNTQCYSPNYFYYYNGNKAAHCPYGSFLCDTLQCYVCDSPSIPINNACVSTCTTSTVPYGAGVMKKCLAPCSVTQYMSWNDTCFDTCDPPLVKGTDSHGNTCSYPCSLSTSSFLYWNGSCMSTCPYHQRNENNHRFCDVCEPGNYMYDSGTCLSSCLDPLVIMTVGGSSFCHSPCRADQFLYDNGSCLSLCPSPHIQSILEGIQFCKGCSYPYRVLSPGFCELDLSEDQITQANTLSTAINKLDTTLDAASFLATFVASSDPTMFCVTSFTKMLFYIRYMDVAYSPMLQKILDNQRITKSSLHPPASIKQEAQRRGEKYSLPENFERYSLSPSFLMNSWSPLISLIIILCGVFLCWMLVASTKKFKGVNAVCVTIDTSIRWNLFMTFLLSNYDSVVLFSSFEFRTLSFDSSLAIVDFLAALFCNLVVFVVLFRVIMIVSELRHAYTCSVDSLMHLSDTKYKHRAYKVYFELFKEPSVDRQCFLLIFSCKVYVFYLIIAYLPAGPLAQAILITMLSLCMTLYLATRRPFKQKLKLAQHITLEAILLVANICVLTTAICDYCHENAFSTRNTSGNVIIACNVILRLLGPVFAILQVASPLKVAYDNIKKKRQQESRNQDDASIPNAGVANNSKKEVQIINQSLERSDINLVNFESNFEQKRGEYEVQGKIQNNDHSFSGINQQEQPQIVPAPVSRHRLIKRFKVDRRNE